MKRLSIFVLVLTITVLPLVFTACGDSSADQSAKPDEKITLVETAKVSTSPFTDEIRLIGVVKPMQTSQVASAEGGKIIKFLKDKGSFVNTGDVICVLDNTMLKANLDAAEANFKLAEVTFSKQEEIYKKNASSEYQFLQAKYQRDAAKAQYELTKERYENSFVKAPFSGVVDAKYLEVGEVAGPGIPIVTVINPGSVKVEVGVPEVFVQDVKLGTPVKVFFRELGKEVAGRVSFVGKSISTNNRTFPIETLVPNTGGMLRPELKAEVRIQKKQYSEMIMIPENVVGVTDLGNVVFVAKDGKADMRVVTIAGRSDNKVAVSEGIQVGEDLIVVGFKSLIDGEKIKINN